MQPKINIDYPIGSGFRGKGMESAIFYHLKK